MGNVKVIKESNRLLNFIKKRPRAGCWTLIVVSFCIHSTSVKVKAQLHNSAVSAALANAGVAAAEIQDALYLNPGVLPVIRGYNLSVNYGASDGRITDSSTYGLAISDNTPDSFVPVAFGYQAYDSEQGGSAANLSALRLAFGNYINPQLSLGVGLTYLSGSNDYTDIDLGILYVPNPMLGFGLAAYNLLGGGESGRSPERRQKLAVGGQYLFGDFFRMLVEAQYFLKSSEEDSGALNAMLGFETALQRFVRLRFGYQLDQVRDENLWSLGLGFPGPRFRLNYAFQVRESGQAHLIDLVVPF